MEYWMLAVKTNERINQCGLENNQQGFVEQGRLSYTPGNCHKLLAARYYVQYVTVPALSKQYIE